MNKAILVGNLGQDPELFMTQSGMAILTLRMATNDRVKRDGEWVDEAQWHTVKTFGKRAEGLNKFLRKGTKLAIEGRITTRKWQDKEGNNRYSTEVIADNVEALGSKGEGANRTQGLADKVAAGADKANAFADADDFVDDDIPF